ncbi:MAG: NAD(P)-binding protein [Rubrivivax sp.]|nr:NAD(P)-binding protein [Rubrivivax sp.]
MNKAVRLKVGIVGAGMAGLACAQALASAGAQVQLIDKGRGPGGRLATRRVTSPDDSAHVLGIDHGAQILYPRNPGFAAWLAGGEAAGWAAPWTPRRGGAWATGPDRTGWVGVPGMSALAQALRQDLAVACGQPVVRLARDAHAPWTLHDAAGTAFGPFDCVVLALPPAQAATLLATWADAVAQAWATELQGVAMLPCWTLMAVTDDTGHDWDVMEPETGPLAWVARNHRKPGRATPAGLATWVAQAGAAWTQAHRDDAPARVQDALQTTLQGLLAPPLPTVWHHVAVHRWLYALPPAATPGAPCRWDAALGLGLCGDHFAGRDVEAAWHSGRALARAIALAPSPD